MKKLQVIQRKMPWTSHGGNRFTKNAATHITFNIGTLNEEIGKVSAKF
jgi:hypothetical protein